MTAAIWPHLSATGERKNNRGKTGGRGICVAVKKFVEMVKIIATVKKKANKIVL